jgi:hypothetical protein
MTSLDADIRPVVAVFMMGFKYGYRYLSKQVINVDDRAYFECRENEHYVVPSDVRSSAMAGLTLDRFHQFLDEWTKARNLL